MDIDERDRVAQQFEVAPEQVEQDLPCPPGKAGNSRSKWPEAELITSGGMLAGIRQPSLEASGESAQG